ncbi:MAG: inorganic diphosphatase [Flavisolibacter sp.]
MSKADNRSLDVIIETPKGDRNKYVYDQKKKAYRLKKILPAGSVFPFDFGFIPDTRGEDGDPLDVLVIMDEPAYPGCILEVQIIGVLKALQIEKNKAVRNDRLVAVSTASHMYKGLEEITDLDKNIQEEIKQFFVSYNMLAGKEFKPEGWEGAKKARKLIKKAAI